MNTLINAIADNVLQRNFDTCDENYLKNLAEQYPYASAIQLLYAQKLKEKQHAAFEAQWQKTLLHFNNPLLVHHLFYNGNKKHKTHIVKDEITGNEIATVAALPQQIHQAYEEDMLTEHITIKNGRNYIEDAIIDDEAEVEIENTNNENNDDALLSPSTDTIVDNDIHNLSTNNTTEEDTSTADEEINQNDDGEEIINIPQLKIEPIDPAKAELSFTPYYTIDYFGSQGIKIKDDGKVPDNFGKQLKSFTDWLKHMKRLPGAANTGNITISEERKIEDMAQQSLTGENAETEAMADVWKQQGQHKKAIAIYQKLSLQNPAKSAYFAAKIDHLKKLI